MELLSEILESDLLYFCIGITLICAVLPQKTDKSNCVGVLVCFCIYILAEIVISFLKPNYLITFLCLFVGSAALSVSLGKLLRLLIRKLKH